MFGIVIVVFVMKGIFESNGIEQCIDWVSTEDNQFRSHCYWFQTASSDITVFEAHRQCSLTGDGLAPYIDPTQYAFLLSVRVYTGRETYIGVTDNGNEGIWTHLDGTEIANNKFPTTYDGGQPNGGTGQNCAVIMESSGVTHDRECHNLFTSDMLCYRNNLLGTSNCLSWTSVVDGVARDHCYWVASKPPSASQFRLQDAMKLCRSQGGTIAPIIDGEQAIFLRNVTRQFVLYNSGASIWIGSHMYAGVGQNWNLDPFSPPSDLIPVPITINANPQERCLILNSALTPSWHLCSSDFEAVMCIKSAVRYNSLVTVTAQKQNISMSEIISDIKVDVKETKAYKLSKISVYEDRPTAKAIGWVGIAILIGTLLFVVILDCQALERVCSKKKGKSQNGGDRGHGQ